MAPPPQPPSPVPWPDPACPRPCILGGDVDGPGLDEHRLLPLVAPARDARLLERRLADDVLLEVRVGELESVAWGAGGKL